MPPWSASLATRQAISYLLTSSFLFIRQALCLRRLLRRGPRWKGTRRAVASAPGPYEMANENAVQETVASEPKLFVGQVPMDCSEEKLAELLQQHATLGEKVSVTIPKRSNIPQTCRFAMATFGKWASAEAALEALHGSQTLGAKPLVVRFADPPKGDESKGIVPKKLFVGQVR